MKNVAVVFWLSFLAVSIAGIFWHFEWIYNLPTPVPINYHKVETGNKIALPSSLTLQNGKPVLFHFYNPDCPCSKFNAAHFRALVRQYGKQVNFVIVPVSNKEHSVEEIHNYFNLQIPVLFDTSFATKCGVYSTPQAVIVDTQERLYYRGNYNRNRYCTDKKTEYALQALDSLLQRKSNPFFDAHALTAYGCKLPV